MGRTKGGKDKNPRVRRTKAQMGVVSKIETPEIPVVEDSEMSEN